MIFSNRTDWNLAENDLSAAVRAHLAAGADLLDLTVSNPTECGFQYEAEALLAPLAHPAALLYAPASLGTVSARAAVSAYYSDMGIEVAVDRICLTTSTSEAYSFLFRLLCDPGDEILIARPSYPLFEYIAQLDGVQLREYPLFYDPNADPNMQAHGLAAHGWSIDLHALEAAVGPRTRAVVVVHPNNPTGNFVSASERAALQALCARRGLALLVDEVFLDYAVSVDERAGSSELERGEALSAADGRAKPVGGGECDTGHGVAAADAFPGAPCSFTGEPVCLTFVLSGLSKVCALPQMKVSWIAVCGPEELVTTAMARLEIIADTFLSVNMPMQLALPHWLPQRHKIQRQIRARLRHNLAVLDHRLGWTAGTQRTLRGQHSLAQRFAMQAGWTTVLRVPRSIAGSDFATAAVGCGVLVQPGEFYGMPAGRVVLSLLTPPERWDEGLRRLPIDVPGSSAESRDEAL